MMWMIAAVLAVMGIVLFVLPHHRGYESSASLAKDLREFLTEGQIETPATLVLLALGTIGCLGVLLPSLLAALMAFVPDRAARGALIIGGVALVIAAALTFFVEIVSNMMIGFGSGSKYPITTFVAYLAPLFPFACGVAAVVMSAARVRIP